MRARRLRIDGNNVCVSARATTQPVVRRQRVKRRRWHVARQRRLEDKRQQRCDKWGIASCDNQMTKKRLRQICEAEAEAVQQHGQRNNQLANKWQTRGEAYKRQTGGEASADKRWWSTERTRGGGVST
jgi:hypothetical protein